MLKFSIKYLQQIRSFQNTLGGRFFIHFHEEKKCHKERKLISLCHQYANKNCFQVFTRSREKKRRGKEKDEAHERKKIIIIINSNKPFVVGFVYWALWTSTHLFFCNNEQCSRNLSTYPIDNIFFSFYLCALSTFCSNNIVNLIYRLLKHKRKETNFMSYQIVTNKNIWKNMQIRQDSWAFKICKTVWSHFILNESF